MTPEKEKEFIDECLSWIGTKWMHGVGLKGYGVDCVQFIVEVAINTGLVSKDIKIEKYSRDWALHSNNSRLTKYLVDSCYLLPKKSELKIADILIFKFARTDGHMGFYFGDNTFIHSFRGFGVMKDNFLRPVYQEHFRQAWRIKSA